MDVETTTVNIPARTIEVPSQVTVDMPKQIVLERKTVLIAAGVIATVYVGSKVFREYRLRRKIRQVMDEPAGSGTE